VEADYAVELGADDETLELPWADADGGPRYFDLKRHPELLLNVEEAIRVPELGAFLAAINSPAGILETAKCDSWSSTEINPEEEIFHATHKFCSYVDIVFSQASRYSFADHEQFAKRVTQLLKRALEIPAAAELLVRRAFYHVAGEVQEGFYITFYLFGYGDDEAQARQSWANALKLVENAMVSTM
jgi:formylmethanofuran dehydrogenase subunit E-like metal-binding protein